MVRGRSMPCGGFTIIELMFVAALFSVILGGAGTFIIGAWRMSRSAFADATLATELREVRERVLFHAAPAHGGTVWSGVLSGGDPGVENSMKVLMSANGVKVSDGGVAGQNIQLVRHSDSQGGWLLNDGDRTMDKWLRPMESRYLSSDWIEDGKLASRGVFFIDLAASRYGVTRHARLAVPLFGRVQANNSTGLFAED